MFSFDFSRYRHIYCADFETSTEQWKVDKARVWLWDICNKNLIHKTGTDIDSFMFTISKSAPSTLYTFHNLAYDGAYIISWLLEQGYTHKLKSPHELKYYEFTTIISNLGAHYAYAIRFPTVLVTIMDSLKYIAFSEKVIAEKYNLPIAKGEIDYDRYREEGYTPTDEELYYIHNDTEIVMRAIQIKLALGYTRFTEAGNARAMFKSTFNKSSYLCNFPELSLQLDAWLRKAYFGGVTQVNPLHQNEDLENLISLDENSMYPAQMLHEYMPYGYPIHADGKLTASEKYPIFIQKLYCSFNLKPNKTPTIGNRSLFHNSSAHFLTTSGIESYELTLSSPDLELFFDNYDVEVHEWQGGYYFMAKKGREITPEEAEHMTVDEIIQQDGKGSLFYEYILPHRMKKEHAKGADRVEAKKMQNALYGALASNPKRRSSIPYLDENDTLHYKLYDPPEAKATGYLPCSIFITAWARYHLINIINANKERFVYCDTDSLYLIGNELPNVPTHPSLYGYFKIEHIIKKARFIGAKRYIYFARTPEKDEWSWTVTCCGASEEVKSQMNWDNFVVGHVFTGKLAQKTVKGGKHLVTTTYKLSG